MEGRSGRDHAPANGVEDQPGCLMDVEFGHNVGAVRFDGLDADAEGRRDFLGRLTFRHQLEHVALPCGEGIAVASVITADDLDQMLGQTRADVNVAVRDGLDGTAELVEALLLEHVSPHAGANCIEDAVVLFMNGYYNGLDFGVVAGNGARGVDAVQPRHRDVQDRDVRTQRSRQTQRFVAVTCLAEHLEPTVAQEGPQAFSYDRVVFCQQDP